MRIQPATAESAERYLPQLARLIVNAVDSGASIGWLPPMPEASAKAYWCDRFAAVREGKCVLLLALEGETVIGTAQLNLDQRENGLHRAEVQKVLVHPDYRQRGIGRRLMQAIEAQAAAHRRTMLFLDVREGDIAEGLYRAVGFTQCGVIPHYVVNGEGAFEATVLYYKILT